MADGMPVAVLGAGTMGQAMARNLDLSATYLTSAPRPLRRENDT